ncbi:uncharacterized protein VTP21DRAFT_1759 [Calcarisporiella thermophila]|uniref:uncharacterized protein n=1 Tax=Calcarisporiella thermophila TaxID=911321 RepID=UPI003742D810
MSSSSKIPTGRDKDDVRGEGSNIGDQIAQILGPDVYRQLNEAGWRKDPENWNSDENVTVYPTQNEDINYNSEEYYKKSDAGEASGSEQYNDAQYNTSQYDNAQYDNEQYYNEQYYNEQYENDRFDNDQYNNEACYNEDYYGTYSYSARDNFYPPTMMRSTSHDSEPSSTQVPSHPPSDGYEYPYSHDYLVLPPSHNYNRAVMLDGSESTSSLPRSSSQETQLTVSSSNLGMVDRTSGGRFTPPMTSADRFRVGTGSTLRHSIPLNLEVGLARDLRNLEIQQTKDKKARPLSLFSTGEISRLYNDKRRSQRLDVGQSPSSTTLLMGEGALKLYRAQAKKTDNPSVQISFAKYLIEQANAACKDDDKKEMGEKLMEEAIYWVDKLSNKGYGEACFIKGTWYEKGLFRHLRSPERAKALYSTAAKQNFPAANFKLGQFYENTRHFAKAMSYYKRAGALGDARANFKLAMVHLEGSLRQTQNYKFAMGYLKVAARAATAEFPLPIWVLGQILADEYPTPIPHEFTMPDPDAACSQFMRAASLGYPPAILRMAQVWEKGELGRPMNTERALELYREAAELGELEAMIRLSRYYLEEDVNGMARDETLAFEWARKAAEGGLPEGELAMGHLYEFGIGCEVNLDAAQRFYQLAADHGIEAARTRLKSHDIGTISRKQGEEALKRLKRRRKGARGSDCTIS